MNWEIWAYLVSVIVSGVAASVLVFYRDFDDKVLGRIGLFCIILASAAVLHDEFSRGEMYQVLRTTLFMQMGLALFLVRMCVAHFTWWKEKKRFHRRADDMRTLF